LTGSFLGLPESRQEGINRLMALEDKLFILREQLILIVIIEKCH